MRNPLINYDRGFLLEIAVWMGAKCLLLAICLSRWALTFSDGRLHVFGTVQEDALGRSMAGQMGVFLAELHGWLTLLFTLPLLALVVCPFLNGLFSSEEYLWLRFSAISPQRLMWRALSLTALFPALSLATDALVIPLTQLWSLPVEWHRFRASILNVNSGVALSCALSLLIGATLPIVAKARAQLASAVALLPVLTGFFWWTMVEKSDAALTYVSFLPVSCPFLSAMATRSTHAIAAALVSLAMAVVTGTLIARASAPAPHQS